VDIYTEIAFISTMTFKVALPISILIWIEIQVKKSQKSQKKRVVFSSDMRKGYV
jgi:hypothetical protein